MNLIDYVASCTAEDEFPTQRVLFLGGEIIGEFRNLRGASETSVAEYGVHLFWNAMSKPQLTTGKERMSGGERAVDLKTKEICNNPLYIGDCHTHPYRKKMGAEARIGPSSGDFEEWWAFPPAHFKIALHFVVSSAMIYLVLQRKATLLTRTQLYSAFGTVTPDTQALGVVQDKCMQDEQFNKRYLKAYESKNPDKTKDYAAMRELEKEVFPNLASNFSAANLKMNVDLANSLRFEYYTGEMDEGGKALAECKLTLASHPVYKAATESLQPNEKKELAVK